MCNWTKEEDKYLEELLEVKMADGQPFPVDAIHIFFNNYFVGLYEDYNPRSRKAVGVRVAKIKDRLERESKPEPKPEPEVTTPHPETTKFRKKRGNHPKSWKWDTSVPNAGKSWSIVEEQYLINHWTSDEKNRKSIATHLGRTVVACSNKYGAVKRKDNGEYVKSLINNTDIDVSVVNEMNEGLISRFISWLYRRSQRRNERKAERKAKRNRNEGRKYHEAQEKKMADLKAQLEKLEGNYE